MQRLFMVQEQVMGVILVTTKKGANKSGFGVSYNGNFTGAAFRKPLRCKIDLDK